MYGTLGEKISAYLWQETKYTAAWFNKYMVPSGLLLLILMGIGPLIPWRKVTKASLKKNFFVPGVIALAGTALLYFADVYQIQQHIRNTTFPIGDVPLGRLIFVADLTGVYALFGFWGVIFVVYTMVREFIKAAQLRQKSTKESFSVALGRLMSKQKRRYGGYLTQWVCWSLLGIIGTGPKSEKDIVFAEVGADNRRR